MPITLRIGVLTRTARIARHDAMYYASESSQTFEEINVSIVSPVDFEEIDDVNLAKDTENTHSLFW